MSISPVSNLQAAKLIVDPTPGNGNYTTIQAAINAAVSGQTILIKPGTYTENPALKAGVNLAAFTGDDDSAVVKIIGKCTFSSAGTALISNIAIQTNSDYAIEVTGSVASAVSLDDCSIICSNNTGIHFTSSSSTSSITLNTCAMDLQTTGIAYFTHAGAGNLRFEYCINTNSGASTTASTCASGNIGYFYSQVAGATTISGTGGIQCLFPNIDCSAINTTCLTAGGSGAQSFFGGVLSSGSAVAVAISTTLRLTDCTIRSTNTNAITGGTLNLANLSFTNNAGVTSTIVKQLERHGQMLSTTQPAFSATKSAPANGVVGNGATVTVLFDNVLYDQNGDFNAGTGVFTAPYTGRYSFTSTVTFTSTTNAMNGYSIALVATGQTFTSSPQFNAANGPTSNTIDITQQLSMTAGDTIHVEVTITGGAANNANIAGSGSPYVTFFSGHLMF